MFLTVHDKRLARPLLSFMPVVALRTLHAACRAPSIVKWALCLAIINPIHSLDYEIITSDTPDQWMATAIKLTAIIKQQQLARSECSNCIGTGCRKLLLACCLQVAEEGGRTALSLLMAGPNDRMIRPTMR